MISQVELSLDGAPMQVSLRQVLAAGYTGRERSLVQEHIDELAELGIAPPPGVPMLYPVMPTLVTTSRDIAVFGPHTTPEIEVAIVRVDGEDYVTVASDQTDRRMEVASVPQSKNACPKIIGRDIWRVQDVLAGWDDLELTARCNGVVLQNGKLASMMSCEELIALAQEYTDMSDGTLLMSGTVPTLATPPVEGTIELVLHDPSTGRTIEHAYSVHVLREFIT